VIEAEVPLSAELAQQVEESFGLVSPNTFFESKSEDFYPAGIRLNHYLKFAQVSQKKDILVRNLWPELPKLNFALSSANVDLCLQVFSQSKLAKLKKVIAEHITTKVDQILLSETH